MILPDVNLLLYAHNEIGPFHERARVWWEDLLHREQPIGIPWVVALAFIRLTTSPSMFGAPLAPQDAVARVRYWFDQPGVESWSPVRVISNF